MSKLQVALRTNQSVALSWLMAISLLSVMGCSSSKAQTEEQQVMAAHEQLTNAILHKDINAVDAALADDFLWVMPNNVRNKPQTLRERRYQFGTSQRHKFSVAVESVDRVEEPRKRPAYALISRGDIQFTSHVPGDPPTVHQEIQNRETWVKSGPKWQLWREELISFTSNGKDMLQAMKHRESLTPPPKP